MWLHLIKVCVKGYPNGRLSARYNERREILEFLRDVLGQIEIISIKALSSSGRNVC